MRQKVPLLLYLAESVNIQFTDPSDKISSVLINEYHYIIMIATWCANWIHFPWAFLSQLWNLEKMNVYKLQFIIKTGCFSNAVSMHNIYSKLVIRYPSIWNSRAAGWEKFSIFIKLIRKQSYDVDSICKGFSQNVVIIIKNNVEWLQQES